MSVSKIESALLKAYKDAAFFTDEKTQFENMAFTHPNGEPWGAVYFMPSQPDVSTLGTAGTDRIDGVFQIDLNFPQNSGTKDARDKSDAVRNTFTAGRRFSYSGQEVVIASCGRSQGRVVNGFYRIVMSVFFYAHVIRNN